MSALFSGFKARFFPSKEKTEASVQKTKAAWFSKVTQLFDRPTFDESLWEELEELLIMADVGMETSSALIAGVKDRVRQDHLKEPAQVREALKQEMVKLLQFGGSEGFGLPDTGLAVVLVVGVNGVGKTTSIAKLSNSLKVSGRKVLLAAGDTFRAAAIDQLKLWGERVGVEVIANQPGSDPGAVVFDSLQAATSRGADTLIIDTAGRLHTKFNLMEELKKVRRVVSRVDAAAPHQVLLVIDATTGQNGLTQAKHFTEAVGVTGIFLAKLDGTAKGGIILPICRELKLPVYFIGTGEKLDDITPFDPKQFVEALFD